MNLLLARSMILVLWICTYIPSLLSHKAFASEYDGTRNSKYEQHWLYEGTMKMSNLFNDFSSWISMYMNTSTFVKSNENRFGYLANSEYHVERHFCVVTNLNPRGCTFCPTV